VQSESAEPSQTIPFPGPTTEVQQRDNYRALYPDTVYGLRQWLRFEAGLWQPVPSEQIKDEITEVCTKYCTKTLRPSNHLTKSVYELTLCKRLVKDQLWNADAESIVFQNGILDLNTWAFRIARNDDYFTSWLPYDYEQDAQATNWQNYLWSLDLAPDVLGYLQEFAGYCLTTDTQYETTIWLLGSPGAGKSTYLRGLQTMLGERSREINLTTLGQNRFALQVVVGRTLLTAGETSNGRLNCTDLLNKLVSGEPIEVEKKGVDPIEYRPRVKLAIAMNTLPRNQNPNDGIFRRAKIVKFPSREGKPIDTTLGEKLSSEGPGIIVWALVGLRRLRARGRFIEPVSVTETIREFREQNDLTQMFFDECCTRDAKWGVRSAILYRHFRDWCKEQGVDHPPTTAAMKHEWERIGLTWDRDSSGILWKGAYFTGQPENSDGKVRLSRIKG
jgi:P4 family phage/plasmid primase-like protien